MMMWEILMQRSKSELLDSAYMMDETIPKSWKKERIARRMAEIVQQKPERVLPMLPLKTVNWLKTLPEDRHTLENPLAWQWNAASFCAHIGLACTDMNAMAIHIAEDAPQVIAQWNVDPEIHEEIDRIADCTVGIVKTYGALPFKEAERILGQCFPEWGIERLSWLMEARADVCEALEWVRVDLPDGPEEMWLSGRWIGEKFGELYEHVQLLRQVEYRMFSQQEYIDARHSECLKRPASIAYVMDEMAKLGVIENDAERLLRRMQIVRQQQIDPEKMAPMNALVENMAMWGQDFSAITHEFAEAVSNFMNDVPMWALKGHSPGALMAYGQRHPFGGRH